MKFNVNQQDLQQALNYCQGVIEKRSTLPILSNILLNVQSSILTLTATDLDLIFIHQIENIEVLEEGKTTTTSLVASVLSRSNLDPTIINGGVLKSFNNSARLGRSNWSIVELDESDGSFLKVQPTYSIITNIDKEHMDYYKSMDKLLNLFGEYINKVPSFGKSFICIDDKNNSKLIKSLKIKN